MSRRFVRQWQTCHVTRSVLAVILAIALACAVPFGAASSDEASAPAEASPQDASTTLLSGSFQYVGTLNALVSNPFCEPASNQDDLGVSAVSDVTSDATSAAAGASTAASAAQGPARYESQGSIQASNSAAQVDKAGPFGQEYYNREEILPQINQGLRDHSQSIHVYYHDKRLLTEQDILDLAYDAMLMPRPEINAQDYLLWSFSGIKIKADVYRSSEGYFYDTTYTVSYYTTAAQEQELFSQLSISLAELDLSGTSLDKMRTIYAYVCSKVSYDMSSSVGNLGLTAYGALVEGKAVCQGYAQLVFLMCRSAGIDVRVIAGQGAGVAHGWNIVQMDDGLYYNVDATWDAGVDPSEWKCFLVTDESLTGHVRHGSNGVTLDKGDYLPDYTSAEFYQAYPMGEVNYLDVIDPGQNVLTGWQLIDGLWYYYLEDGARYTGWMEHTDGLHYWDENGTAASGVYYTMPGRDWADWTSDVSNWYLFDAGGTVHENKTGWYYSEPDQAWCFLTDSVGHVKVNGWLKRGTTWYWFDQGRMAQNSWRSVRGSTYYLGDSGALATGWFKTSDGVWHWADSSGAAFSQGWKQVSGTWYWFDQYNMASSSWVKSGGRWYFMSSSGAMATGWLKRGSTWYYLNSSGAMATGWVKSGGDWYYMKGSGAMVTGWYQWSDGSWSYFGSSGAAQTGWVKSSGRWYYIDPVSCKTAA